MYTQYNMNQALEFVFLISVSAYFVCLNFELTN